MKVNDIEEQAEREVVAFDRGYQAGRTDNALATLLCGVVVGVTGLAFWLWIF